MEGTEVRKLAALEDRHWWYAERRALLARDLQGLAGPSGPSSSSRPAGVRRRALDIGAAGGGNTRVLLAGGWDAIALEYGEDGVLVCGERGIPAVRGDATALPVASDSIDLVVAFDVLEHLVDDVAAAAEVARVLHPDGVFLVAVPAGMANWSTHDVAVGHVRRYERDTLTALLDGAGFDIVSLRSWNVLLAPVARLRRRHSSGSDLDQVGTVANAGARAVVALERYLPLGKLPGLSLLATCRPRRAPGLASADAAT